MRTLIFDDRFPTSVTGLYDLLWADGRFLKVFLESLGDQDVEVSDWTQVEGISQRKIKHKRTFSADGFRALAGQNWANCEGIQTQLWLDDELLEITHRLRIDAPFFKKYVQIHIHWTIRTNSVGCQMVEKVYMDINHPEKASTIDTFLARLCHEQHSEFVRLARSEVSKATKKAASFAFANRSAVEKDARMEFYVAKLPRLKSKLQRVEKALSDEKGKTATSFDELQKSPALSALGILIALVLAQFLYQSIAGVISFHGIFSATHNLACLLVFVALSYTVYELRNDFGLSK